MRKLFIHHSQNINSQVQQSYDYSIDFLKNNSTVVDNELPKFGSSLGIYDHWLIIALNNDEYEELIWSAKEGSKVLSKHGQEGFLQSQYSQYYGLDDVLISFNQEGAGLSLLSQIKMKPLILDFELQSYRQRLLRGGRQKEAVARAVMNGLDDGALVFDATAGLGRESMILAHAKATVIAFERQLPIWLILHDALNRAQNSRFFPFTLPKLSPIGTIKNYAQVLEQSKLEHHEFFSALKGVRPEVIYYDPMFPERENSAQVKKDMFLFQQVIGEDLDIDDFLAIALSLAQKRVVIKRPNYAPPLIIGTKERSHFVDGGQCRFDCYNC